VSIASTHQVFEYNFGGEIDGVDFDARDFKVFNRKSTANATAYMLVYVKCEVKDKLLSSEAVYPKWLKEHEIIKQGEREEIKNRKSYYHNVQAIYWNTDLKDTVACYLGLIPKNFEDAEGATIEKLAKS
jgi:nanoRNase/pAp phosphatase (c-di-AMP/oligoRNAs hydrolase)